MRRTHTHISIAPCIDEQRQTSIQCANELIYRVLLVQQYCYIQTFCAENMIVPLRAKVYHFELYVNILFNYIEASVLDECDEIVTHK